MSAHRVVVVGHGMVAARFVEDLLGFAEPGAFAVTVLGAEPHLPYNRLLLSEVIAGRAKLGGLQLPSGGEDVRVLTDTEVIGIDRDRRVVLDRQGLGYGYDTLVLATGASPRMPLPDKGLRGVRSLRTLDDCRDLLAAARPHARIAVLGGGLLGVELAAGLAFRGAAVTLVHRTATLLDRQLSGDAAEVLAAGLRAQGIEVLLETEIVGTVGHDGALTALRAADGALVPADLVVVSAGVAARTELALAAGLPVARGIVVGSDLRSPADPSIAAIGDCAEEQGNWTGLLAPGWDQARRLARSLTGRHPQPPASVDPVVTLKARGLSVVTMGTPGVGRTITLSDPAAGRHLSVEVDGDRLTAATCVGAPKVAANLAAAFDRGTPVPADPAFLLLPELAGAVTAAAPSPATMPGGTTVCRCNGVTKRQIVQAHAAGDRDLGSVAERTRATTGCGGCTSVVAGLLAWMDEVDPPTAGPGTDSAQVPMSRPAPQQSRQGSSQS